MIDSGTFSKVIYRPIHFDRKDSVLNDKNSSFWRFTHQIMAKEYANGDAQFLKNQNGKVSQSMLSNNLVLS